MFISTYLGANIFNRNYVAVVVVSVATGAVLLVVYIFRKKLTSFITKNRKPPME